MMSQPGWFYSLICFAILIVIYCYIIIFVVWYSLFAFGFLSFVIFYLTFAICYLFLLLVLFVFVLVFLCFFFVIFVIFHLEMKDRVWPCSALPCFTFVTLLFVCQILYYTRPEFLYQLGAWLVSYGMVVSALLAGSQLVSKECKESNCSRWTCLVSISPFAALSTDTSKVLFYWLAKEANYNLGTPNA